MAHAPKPVTVMSMPVVPRGRVGRVIARGCPLRDACSPVIAVCLATCDPRPDLLVAQLESLRSQRGVAWTCVVDDESASPAGRRALREALAGDERFDVREHGDLVGPYRNFERCLARAGRDVEAVAPCDQDDVWHPGKLEVLLAALRRRGATLAYADLRIVDAGGAVLSPTYWTNRDNSWTDLGDLLATNVVTGAASLVRRDVLDVALPFPEALEGAFQDHWLACVALALGDLAYVDRPLVDYVQHGANVVGHSERRRRARGAGRRLAAGLGRDPRRRRARAARAAPHARGAPARGARRPARALRPVSATSARGEAEDQVCGLERDVELWAVADAVELDPVGVGQPVVAEAGGGRRPGQQPVFRAPHDPHGAGDPLGLDAPALDPRVLDQGERRIASRRASHLVGEQLGRDVLEVRGDVPRRAPPAVSGDKERLGVRRRGLQQLVHRRLEAQRVLVGVVARRPAAGRRERHDLVRPAARGELERDVASERVADDVRGLEVGVVHRAL